jgi:hypothetical protein
MPLPTITVKDGQNVDRTVFGRASGRQEAADSQAVVLSTQDLAAVSGVGTAVVDALAAGLTFSGTPMFTLAAGAEVAANFVGSLPAGSATIGGVEVVNTPAVVDGTAAFVFTPASGTSTGSAIEALTANPNRRAFQFQNASDTDFTVNFDGTASASAGFLVAPGKVLEFYGAAAPKGAVSVFCGAASKRYVLRTA